MVLGAYYMTRDRINVKGEFYKPSENDLNDGQNASGIFSSPDELRIAFDAGEVHLQAKIKVRMKNLVTDEKTQLIDTTTGRVLLREILPESVPFSAVNKVMTKKELSNLVDTCYRLADSKETVILADRLKDIGFKYANLAGISICLDDMVIPEGKPAIIEKANEDVMEIQNQYTEGLITDGERYNKVIDIWAKATEDIAIEMLGNLSKEIVIGRDGKKIESPSFNAIHMMADSGARGSAQQIRQLAGMRGLMAKPSGEIIETPITANFREGLTVLQYFISTHGARKGLADTALKTANSGYLTRRLVDVAQDAIITETDCGTLDGLIVSSLTEGGEIIEHIGDRILGRVALEDIHDPVTDEVLVEANQEIDENLVKRVEDAGLEKVKIRSVLTCQSKRGICAKCYGRDLSRGHSVNMGEAVGVIAAQSIGEPGTQLTMRTFHIGGTASRRAEQTSLEARTDGTIKYINLNTVVNNEGYHVVMNRNGEVAVIDETGREREKYTVVYGAKIKIVPGGVVKQGAILSEWDPYTMPILTEFSGKVKFADIIEGVTMEEQLDDVTGLSRKVIIETKDSDKRPRIAIKDTRGEGGGTIGRYFLPAGANISVIDDAVISAGDIIAKIPRETTKTKDITGGLPRVAELFEARKPKDFAVITEIDGRVSFGKDAKGKRKVIVAPEQGQGESKEYLIPKGKHISVHEGDHVRAGEPLMDGSSNPHDILRVLGVKELAKYLVDEVQEVYRLQGVKINDKHIEVIVRQMLRRVRIKDIGDTNLLVDDQVERYVFERENEKAFAEDKRPAVAEPLLLGITKASLSTESFISAASFQETTKVLTQAAIEGKIDHLRGLKENVIMGRLIPAGTGIARYRGMRLHTETSADAKAPAVAADAPTEVVVEEVQEAA
jgi:DNA-directed RNA polymerase subunit beta'